MFESRTAVKWRLILYGLRFIFLTIFTIVDYWVFNSWFAISGILIWACLNDLYMQVAVCPA